MNYYIITGTSRGLGEAIAEQLISHENTLFCISRTKNDSLIGKAAKAGCVLEYIQLDLNKSEDIELTMGLIFDKIDKEKLSSLTLINNAGVLKPISPLGRAKHDDIIANIKVNLTAPLLLSSSFIWYAGKLTIPKLIINISSGAGKKPYYGWSTYCASKAGVDLFTQCVGLEEDAEENQNTPTKIISFAPGVVDTAMQDLIRESPQENFRDLPRFKELKEKDQLYSPDFVADKLITLINEKDLQQGGIYDLRDLI